GIVLAITLIALPVLLQERTRDWTAYEQAAGRLQAGEPLYIWELATADDEYYLYPPGMAAAWAAVGSPQLLLLVKVLALLGTACLAPLVVTDPARRRTAAAVIGLGAILWAPNLYDLILGNVMALYVGALAIVVARRGWLGAVPLGVVLALAAKPAIVPFAIWLLLTRPRDAARVAVLAIAVSAVVAAIFGPGRYLEYLQALPQMTTLATSFTGNLGLVTISPLAGAIGLVASIVLALVAGLRLDFRRGAAIALAAMLLAQPTLGFNYAGLLYPALVLLWGVDRRLGTLGLVVVAPLSLLVPVGAAVVVIGLALVSSVARPVNAMRVGRAA
ncbi:MAG: hypothetical protein ABIR11_11455, partial [Candidatus Limnocylindrales bacterium]